MCYSARRFNHNIPLQVAVCIYIYSLHYPHWLVVVVACALCFHKAINHHHCNSVAAVLVLGGEMTSHQDKE